MRPLIREFYDALNSEEGKLVPRLAGDALGINLRCALSELDLCHYNFTNSIKPTHKEFEKFSIFQLGAARLVYLALTSRPAFDVPVVSFPRDPELSATVLEMCASLGIIQHGRRIAQYISMGLGEIEQGEPEGFNIKLPSRIANEAGHEKDVLDRFTHASRKQFEALLKSKPLKKWHNKVDKKLIELVRPWAIHFIGYEADPLLDEYFFALAHFQIQSQEGFDTFHYALEFGGIRYQNYVLGLTFLLSNHIRHERFAEALVRKNSSTRLENVLTITADVSPFISSLRDAINYFGTAYESFKEIRLEEAEVIFRTLSYGRHCAELIAAPGAPLPLIVQSSEQSFIHCLTGSRSEPVHFLLDALRHHFPADYDRNQGSREGVMQRAIQRTLSKTFTSLGFHKNFSAKVGKRILTDVDLIVTERASGIILLCQLKHQDIYGSNAHAERIRGERLVQQTSYWLTAVQSWLEQIGIEALRQALGIGGDDPPPSIYRLVVGKHFAYQLRNLAKGRDFLYANWAQLLLAVETMPDNEKDAGLVSLLNRLKEIPELQSGYEYEPEDRVSWCVGKLHFTTYPSD